MKNKLNQVEVQARYASLDDKEKYQGKIIRTKIPNEHF